MLTGIIGSLIATLIWMILAYIYTEKYKTKIKGFFVTALNVGVSNIFSSELDKEFIKDLKHELEKSSYFSILYSALIFILSKQHIFFRHTPVL